MEDRSVGTALGRVSFGILIPWLCFVQVFSASAEFPESGCQLGIVLEPDVIRVTEVEPLYENKDFKVILKNMGDEPLALVRPGDGSRWAMRTPVVHWSLVHADDPAAVHAFEPGTFLGEWAPRGCGNTSALREGETFLLEPGEVRVFDDTEFLAPDFLPPGDYQMRLFFANRPDMEWRGSPLGTHSFFEMKLVRASTPCEAASNEIRVEVEPDARRYQASQDPGAIVP